MARKVCCRGAAGLGQAGGTAPEQGRGCSVGLCPCCACIEVCHAWGAQARGVEVLGGIQALSQCPAKHPALVGVAACARC